MSNSRNAAADSALESRSTAGLFALSFWVPRNIGEGGVDLTIQSYLRLWGLSGGVCCKLGSDHNEKLA